MARRTWTFGLSAALAAAGTSAGACPVCESPQGRELRGRLFGDAFPRDAALVGAPAAVLLVSGLAVERALRARGRR